MLGMPILKTKNAVKCMTCSAPTVGADQNPTAGEYFVNIKWGRNVHKSGTGSAFEEDVLEGYKVVIVDSDMRMLQVAATVPKDGKQPENCCKMVYSKTVKGTWPTGGAKFMVVPYSTGTGAQDYENVPDSFILPMGQVADFTDIKAGAGKVIQGTLALSVNNVNAIKKTSNGGCHAGSNRANSPRHWARERGNH